MTRPHRSKRNDGKPCRDQSGATLELGSSGVSKTVMIVEDNELNMKLFHDLLEAYGYHPIGTRNGIEALDLARKHRPDLILMDIMLPEVSGLEVTKWLKEDAELKRRATLVTAGLAVISLGSMRASHIKKVYWVRTLVPRGQKDWWLGPAAPSDRECA